MVQTAEKNGRVNRIKEIEQTVRLKEISVREYEIEIVGMSPLIQHRWSEKALTMIREKQQGKKTKARDVREPELEAEAATYRTEDGKYAVPAMALKAAIITAAHKDIGIEKTLVRKALFIDCPADMMLPMECSAPHVREDAVRVGQGSADLRYRPQFDQWSVKFCVHVDTDLLQPADVYNLIDRAGFGVGICEWRPEKGGEFGRFRVKR